MNYMRSEKETFIIGGRTEAENFAGVTKQVILMPDRTLDNEAKELLSHELTPITGLGFMRDLTTREGYQRLYEDVYNHVVPCDRLSVFRDSSGKVIAFIAAGFAKHRENNVYHLGGIIVDPTLHHKNFSVAILQRELMVTSTDIIAFHTQSVLMEKLGQKVSRFDVDLAREVAGLIGTGNMQDTQEGPIDKERYGGQSLYEDIARFDSIAIKKPDFNYLKGDAIIFAGYIFK